MEETSVSPISFLLHTLSFSCIYMYTACVKIGSRVWARIEKGCFLRGTVVAVDDLVHIELENGNKVKHKKVATDGECAYVPDIVPHPLEIDVGTRVLARWFNRHDSYYPATVTAIRRSYFNVKYDDGDKGTNNINEIRILKQPEVEGGTNIPSWSSLDGLPRVGGLCIDSTSDHTTTEETLDSQDTAAPRETWLPYPRDISSPDQREYENQNDPVKELDREADFGYENNLQYLSPNIQPAQHTPVARNASQVSGGSADSGYHDNACAGSTRQRRTGLWADLHSKEKERSQFGLDSRFLSPFSCNSNFNTSGEVMRNLSQLSVSSSVDSGYQGGYSRHDTRSRLRDTTKASIFPYHGRAIPANKNTEKDSWDHEDTDPLSDNETSNSTNYSTTNELYFPDTFTSGNTSHFTPRHTTDHAIGHAGHTKSNGGAANATTPTKSFGKDITEDHSSTNGSFVPQNGESASDTRGKIKDYNMFAQNATKDDRGTVPKAVPPRHCPIHHHGINSDRLQGDTSRTKHEYADDAILDSETPRLIGLETVI